MSKLVMIIDDSPAVRKIVEVSLNREGIASISYADGIEALHSLSTQQNLIPDLIFLDVGLPRMDGYKVAQYFKTRDQYKDTTIVMLTGHSGVLDRLKGRLAGAKNYMTKPFRTQDILSIVHEYLNMSNPPLH